MQEHHVKLNTNELITLTEKVMATNYAPVPVVLVEGRGAYAFDSEGKTYLDFLGGFSTLLFGHQPASITEAAHKQIDRLTLTSRAFYNDELALCGQELTELANKDRVVLMNTGAEAIETSLKIARKWGHQHRDIPEESGVIITFSKNFHGRTISIISGSDDALARDGYGPLTPGFVTVPYGDIDAVREAITQHNVVAVLVEPIQGEAGVIIPPPSFLPELREVTAEHDIVLIADEVQSGMGRTGLLFACDHFGVVPDLYAVGKALSGGILPVSAVLGDNKFMDVLTPGTHGSTFGGSPLAAAVTRAVIQELKAPEFLSHVRALGSVLAEELQTTTQLPAVTAVRSLGLWAGVDIDPHVATAAEVASVLRDKGVLVKDTQGKTIRMAPPAVATEEEIRSAIALLREAISSVTQK